MATTRIEYQNKGFWIEDLFIEVLSHFICQTYENSGVNTFNSSVLDVYESCDMNRKYATYPIVNFDEISNPNDQQTLIDVFEQTKLLILFYGTEISASQLNQLEDIKSDESFKNFWEMPIKTASLVTTLSLFQQLLNSTFPYTNKSYHYQGFSGARTQDEII
jgi:hypothetical protein